MMKFVYIFRVINDHLHTIAISMCTRMYVCVCLCFVFMYNLCLYDILLLFLIYVL